MNSGYILVKHVMAKFMRTNESLLLPVDLDIDYYVSAPQRANVHSAY